MPKTICSEWSDIRKPIIGMLHLPPLPGSPRYAGDMQAVREHVLNDAVALEQGGVHGLMLENFGDAPFYKDSVPTHTVTHMTALALAVRERVKLPLGINVLRNDALSAMAVAHAVGASYIRVNVLSGACLTDQGIITGRAAELLRYREQIRADHVNVLADVRVKHAAPLAERPLEQEAEELIERAGADALIVSGSGTGKPTDPDELIALRKAFPNANLLIGSGVTADTLADLAPHADGFIIGSHFKPDGRTDRPIDPARVNALVTAWRNLPPT